MCVAKCAPNACAEKHICIVYQLSAQQELKLFRFCVAMCALNACAEKHNCIVNQLSEQQELDLLDFSSRVELLLTKEFHAHRLKIYYRL